MCVTYRNFSFSTNRLEAVTVDMTNKRPSIESFMVQGLFLSHFTQISFIYFFLLPTFRLGGGRVCICVWKGGGGLRMLRGQT